MRNSLPTPFARQRTAPNLRIVRNAAGDSAEMFIYDDIGPWYGVNARDFTAQLKALGDVSTIHLRINSPGGSVFDAVTIANVLRSHGAHIVSHVDGLAASAATFIATAAHEVRMADNAFFMIHDPSAPVWGNAGEMRKTADLLDQVGQMIANEYVKKTGQTLATVKQWMTDETWFDAAQAKANGFVDHIDGTVEVTNTFDLSVFANTPAKLGGKLVAQDKRDLEKTLRDAGYSISEAKRVAALASHSTPNPRDVETESAELNAQLTELLSFIKN